MELSWHPFAITALILVLLAFATMSYHALRTAWVNPVEGLKEVE